MTFLQPEVARLGYSWKMCHISESIIIPRYCCETICGGCHEAFPSITTCSSLISHEHKHKNASLCHIDKNYCAVEGKFCDNGYYCCTGRNDDWSCNNHVNHRVCSLHCPECYKTIVTYRYDDVFVPQERDFFKKRLSAEKFISKNVVGTKRDCWVNPNDTHDIHFTRSITWWKILVELLFSSPFFVLIGLAIYSCMNEILERDFRISRQEEEPMLTNYANDNNVNDEEQSENEAPPRYSLLS